jgi:hypothetical protein
LGNNGGNDKSDSSDGDFRVSCKQLNLYTALPFVSIFEFELQMCVTYFFPNFEL